MRKKKHPKGHISFLHDVINTCHLDLMSFLPKIYRCVFTLISFLYFLQINKLSHKWTCVSTKLSTINWFQSNKGNWHDIFLVETNECTLDTHDCHANAMCTNTPPGSFTCTCNTGYTDDDTSNPGRTCSGKPTLFMNFNVRWLIKLQHVIFSGWLYVQLCPHRYCNLNRV